MPVATTTARAGQVIWLNGRVAARGTWVPGRQSTGTSAASVSWPPNQMVTVQEQPELVGADGEHSGGCPFRLDIPGGCCPRWQRLGGALSRPHVVPACRPIVPGDLASRPAQGCRISVVPSSRAAKRILISAIQVVECHGVSDGRARDIGTSVNATQRARAATRLREPAGCGSRRKEARAGGIVAMNVLNLSRHVQVRDENDRRATAIGPDRCLRDLVFLHAPGGQVGVGRARRGKTHRCRPVGQHAGPAGLRPRGPELTGTACAGVAAGACGSPRIVVGTKRPLNRR